MIAKVFHKVVLVWYSFSLALTWIKFEFTPSWKLVKRVFVHTEVIDDEQLAYEPIEENQLIETTWLFNATHTKYALFERSRKKSWESEKIASFSVVRLSIKSTSMLLSFLAWLPHHTLSLRFSLSLYFNNKHTQNSQWLSLSLPPLRFSLSRFSSLCVYRYTTDYTRAVI